MKRTVILTAAALLIAGLLSLSLTREGVTDGKPGEETNAEMKNTQTTQPVVNQVAEANPASSTGMSEKKSEPTAENKPAATVSDAAKSTANTVSDKAKEAASESVKSAVPTPNVPTAPAPEATKTVVSPTAPSAPVTMPTK